MFEQTEYDSTLYEEVIKNYENGKHYKIEKYRWGYTKDHKQIKEVYETIECPTQDDFDRELWDLFAKFTEKATLNFVWGLGGLERKNPKRPKVCYYDGVVFYTLKKEFMNCIENQDISHFMSCFIHYGYEHLNFVIVE